MKTLYFDCFAGASGDMILGALIGAGTDEKALVEQLSLLNVDGFKLNIETVDRAYVKEFGMPMGPFALMDEVGLGACAGQAAPGRGRHAEDHLRPGDRGGCPGAVEQRRRRTTRARAEAGRADGRRTRGRPGLHGLAARNAVRYAQHYRSSALDRAVARFGREDPPVWLN